MIRTSNALERVKPSPTLAITAPTAALRVQEQPIVELSAGEPDFEMPMHVVDTVFTPMIPIFMSGEEFDATFRA
jgi:aspartate aminotransferase